MAILRITFFGSFLSSSTGSVGPSEVISESLEGEAECSLVSTHVNPIKRLYHSLKSASCSSIDIAILDIYSTKVIYQTILVFCLLKLRRIKIIAVFHGGGIVSKWDSRSWLFSAFLKYSDVVTAPSMRMCSFAANKGYKVRYLPNPIDLSVFKKIPAVEKVESGLLWVRAFSEIYNPNIAIETLALLKPDFPEVRLTMVGPDKGNRCNSEELVRRLELTDSVTFVGAVPNRELIHFYRSHTVFLNTTSFESFGTAVAEAAATELPIVSSNVGELPYIWVDKKDILFAEELDAECFAKQVRVILKNGEFAQQLGHAAAKRVQEFELSRINAQWISLFDELA